MAYAVDTSDKCYLVSELDILLQDLFAGNVSYMTIMSHYMSPEALRNFARGAQANLIKGTYSLYATRLSNEYEEAATELVGAASCMPDLRNVSLQTSSVSEEADRKLARLIQRHKRLFHLECGRSPSLGFVREALRPDVSLRSLHLHGLNEEHEADMHLVASWVAAGCSLVSLDLSGSPIGDKGAAALAGALTPATSDKPTCLHRRSYIKQLKLGKCHIGAAGFAAIGKCLGQDPAVECLWLGHNSPGDEGMAGLGEGLASNCTLRYLSLQSIRGYGEIGVKGLAEGIAGCRSLTGLHMHGCCPEGSRIGAIADAIGGSAIRRLDLSCIFGQSSEWRKHGSVPRLCDALRTSLQLQFVMLGECDLNGGLGLCIAKAVGRSGSIGRFLQYYFHAPDPNNELRQIIPECMRPGFDRPLLPHGIDRLYQLQGQDALLSLEDRRALLPRRTRALRAIQWIEATHAPTPSGPPCCLRASCMLHLLSQGEPIDPDAVGWYACSALQQLGSRMEDVVVLLSSMLDMTEGMGRAEPEPWAYNENSPRQLFEYSDQVAERVPWAPLLRARVGNGVRGVVGAAWGELAGMDARDGALHCKEDAGAAIPVPDTRRRMAVLRAVVRLGRDLLLRDAKHRQGGMVRWRRAGDARRDAGLVLQAAREGRPLELGQRLVLGALAGGRELLDSALEAARAGGHDECVKVLSR